MASIFHQWIHLGMVPLTQNFRSLGCVTAVRRALKVFAKRYIRSNFQSCHWWTKLKIQSPLTLLIPKIPSLSILSNKCGFYSVKSAIGNLPIWKAAIILNKNHIYGSNLANWVFLESGGTGGFVFSIWAISDNFENLTLAYVTLGKNFSHAT